MSDINESRLYEQALYEAREHLRRWEELGQQLAKTLDPGWQATFAIRQAGVKQLELLIQQAKNRP